MTHPPTSKGSTRIPHKTPQEMAKMFLPGSSRYVRVVTQDGFFFFQVSIFPQFRLTNDGEPIPTASPGTEKHERLCEHFADEGVMRPARFVLEPPIPLSFIEDRDLTLYQLLADAENEGCLARVFCEMFEDELLSGAHFDLSMGEGQIGICPCAITLSVKGICFTTSFMLTEKDGMQYAIYPDEGMHDDEPMEGFSPVFSLV